MTSRKQHWSKDAVRHTATGQWASIFERFGFSAPGRDGSPCPKCGGTDRFYQHGDFDASGGVGCRSCFSTDNQDGFAAVSWFTNRPFPEIVDEIGEMLGVQPEAETGKAKKPKKVRDTVEGVGLDTWSSDLANYWCSKFPPITEQGLLASGAQAVRVNGQGYLGFPGADEDGKTIAWTILDWAGDQLIAGSGEKRHRVKTKLVPGSKPGSVIGSLDGDRLVWKLEGPKDLAAFLSCGLPEGHSAFTTSHGASEKPRPWILKRLQGKLVALVHDADPAGKKANESWSDALRTSGVNHKIIELPFPEGSKKDLRDFLAEGGTIEDLRQLVRTAPAVELPPPDQQVDPDDIEETAIDDPTRLAKENLAYYQREFSGRLVFWQSQWFSWRGSHYKKKNDRELRNHLWGFVFSEFKRDFQQAKAERRDVDHQRKVSISLVENTMAAMEHLCQVSDDRSPPCWIDGRDDRSFVSVQNGLLNLGKLTNLDMRTATLADLQSCLLPHDPLWFSTVCLKYDYDPFAKCPKWLAFLNRSLEGDADKIATLQEWVGYLLLPDTSLQKFLAIQGGGGNGKSVFLAGVTALLGRENVSTVPLEEFGERFSLAATIGKLANIIDEVPETDMAESRIKAFTSGSDMKFELKGKQPFTAVPTARLMFACNDRPRFRDRTNALWRRMLWIEFGRPIQPGERIPGMDKPQWWIDSGELSGMLNWAIWGLYRLRQRGDFAIGEEMSEKIEGYRQESNPARQFIAEHIEFTGDPEDRLRCSELYQLYVSWCKENGVYATTSAKFGQSLREVFPGSARRRIRVHSVLTWTYEGVRMIT